jgi:hypothetical protein
MKGLSKTMRNFVVRPVENQMVSSQIQEKYEALLSDEYVRSCGTTEDVKTHELQHSIHPGISFMHIRRVTA